MADQLPGPNSAQTLSVFTRPGEDVRLGVSNSDSIFTFGDFRVFVDTTPQALTGTPMNLSFDGFSSLESLSGQNFTPPSSVYVSPAELTSPLNEPTSYTYFGSFYSDVGLSINDIIDNFPYAILAYDDGVGTTVYDYTETFNNFTRLKTSSFKIPYTTLINQGNILVGTGSPIGNFNLLTDYKEFGIEVRNPDSSGNTIVSDILYYNFSSDTYGNYYLEFTINDFLDGVTASTSTLPILIRPTEKRFANYLLNIDRLEYNLLFGEKLLVPNIDDDGSSTEFRFTWPRTIDGFNPDTYGSSFEDYKTRILKAAQVIDESKTDILIKTVLPENYIELDSNNRVYRTISQSYAKQFDEIKQYIDNIAYAHSITYNGHESVPTKFMGKLSNLLGWKLSDSFSDLDLFEYLASDVTGNHNSFSYFNIEIWKRILVNIVWLYKKKGTRDAIQFLFKLMGAPECLVVFDEFVYDVNKIVATSFTANTSLVKINENGYISIPGSEYIFQEGGKGRGDGQRYINQWRPEFDPSKRVDNIKVVVGDDLVFGSENILNTKEVSLSLDPAAAIECDVFSFYQVSGSCWVWGSTYPPFSSLTVPFEYIPNCESVSPDSITGMTFAQYIEYVYKSSPNPRNRKTLSQAHTSFYYPELRNAYLNYYLLSNPKSNRLTFHKLQSFVDLLELNFQNYIEQVIPATTILQNAGTVIRNTVFNRQKFVYKEGINDGSEFRWKYEVLNPSLVPINLNGAVNDYLHCNLTPVTIIGTLPLNLGLSISPVQITASINVNNFGGTSNTWNTTASIYPPASMIVPVTTTRSI